MRKYNCLSLLTRQAGVLLIIFVFLFAGLNSFASWKGDKNKNNKTRLSKTAADPQSSLIDINNTTCWVTDFGNHEWVVAASWNGAFPKGTAAGAIFSEGILWGGQVNDGSSPLVRVNGNDYGSGTASLLGRVFRVRPDYQSGDLTDDAANFNNEGVGQVSQGQIDALRAQYAKDWAEWPADQGALYQDVDGNGKYDPAIDVPGIPGASQTMFIMYDDRNSVNEYGSAPIGLKVSETYWAYAYTGALGNIIFKKVDMIYTGTSTSASNSTIDSLFIVQWADPDVGNSTDDFAGCDTALNLGYAYSAHATDAVYAGLGLAPPAVGYDFLQGASQYTGIESDSAIINLQWHRGYKYVNPKPMSSYIYFAAGGKWSDPPFSYLGALQYYNLMRGFLPIPAYPSAKAFPDAVADVTPFGTYLLDGDPVTGTGKIDGSYEGPADRRIMVVNGPLNVKLGDTLEVVTAIVYGMGNDNLGSVAAMKTNDASAQIVYDRLFQLPAIAPPVVQVGQFDNKIVLNWGNDAASVDKIETFSDQGYDFEGYDVYQLRASSSNISDPDNAIKLATFDKIDGITNILDSVVTPDGVLMPVLVENGKDKGIQRYMEFTTDEFTKKPLKNGQAYYYAVVSYAFNPSPILPFHSLKCPVVVKSVIPQSPQLGVRYSSSSGDTVKATHQGSSDGNAEVIVVDPSLTTGNNYEISFANDGTWSLKDVTTGATKLSAQTNQAGDEDYKITDGLLVKVIGPPVAINTWSFTPSSARWFTGYSGLGGPQFFGGLTLGSDFFGSNITPDQYVTVEIRFTTNTADGQKAYRYTRGATPNYGYQDYTQQHFTVWDVTANPPRQITAAYVTQKGSAMETLPWEPTASAGDREYLFILNSPYTDAPDPFYTSHSIWSNAADMPVLYGMWPLQRGTMPYNPQDGQVFKIVPNFANTTNDKFTFTAPAAAAKNADLAKADANLVNVFPNPYYGYQYRESSRDNHYVTFSHLPANATIRLFDLSGVLVRTITKNDPSQFTTWNLQNDSGYPVASGIYVAYIDMPDLGTSKVLKVAIVQEQQILKVY